MLPVSVQGDETQVEDGGGAEEHVQSSVELQYNRIYFILFYLFIYSKDNWWWLLCSCLLSNNVIYILIFWARWRKETLNHASIMSDATMESLIEKLVISPVCVGV